MIICLVTDRRRLGAAIGARPADHIDALLAQVSAAARAGVDLVQIREGDLDARVLTTLTRAAVAACRGSMARVIVNDRLDVAMAAMASGVHLKEASYGPERARRLLPRDAVVGCSVHTPLTAAARHSADFLIAGTVLPTVSKPAADYLEWKGLGEVVAASHGTPVLAIGGLNESSMPMLAATGAAGVAAIGAFIPTSGADLDEFVKKRVTRMRFAFDSARRDS